jgi:hypothetical protein
MSIAAPTLANTPMKDSILRREIAFDFTASLISSLPELTSLNNVLLFG